MDAPVMRVLSTDGVVEIGVPDPRDRSLIIAHWQSIDRVLEGENKSKIGDYKGKRVTGIPLEVQPAGECASSEQPPVDFTLEADPETIKRWGKQGDLDSEDIYVDPP